MFRSSVFDAWLAEPGIVVGAALILGSLESSAVSRSKAGKLAGAIVPIAYIAWSLWLILAGLVLLLG